MNKNHHAKALRRKFAMALETYTGTGKDHEVICKAVEWLINDVARSLADRDKLCLHIKENH